MPIRIPDSLPAARILESENIFVMHEQRAAHQDIRPLKILLVNLMPTKVVTETQILRLLSHSPIQVDVDLLGMATHVSKNTPAEHLLTFYRTFDEICDNRYDGMIVTGAPVEQLPFEQVDYWNELCEVFRWGRRRVYSTLFICWGAQAGLYYHYGVPKVALDKKLSGVFSHRVLLPQHPLLRGFDDTYNAPHSRYTGVRRQDVEQVPALDILTESDEAGLHIIASHDCREFFVTGHSEYDRDTLANEYARDIGKGIAIDPPAHYFPGDDPTRPPVMTWRAHANLLFANWLNDFVYQRTPFDLSELDRSESSRTYDCPVRLLAGQGILGY